MSFGPISALGARFLSSKYFVYSSGRNLAAALTLNQNPIFETASGARARARS